ncbi:hypothetical protein KPL70_021579 [Citrus sinensis]|nr:hypothetical protein KPL70_021579 [Citrus sinensis]
MSPYFLSVSDNPRTIITQLQLRETNYDEWARAMRTALRTKKKFSFVDGTVKQPVDDSADLEDWWMKLLSCCGMISRKGSLLGMDHVCSNSNLSWRIASSEDKKRDEEKLHQFLMGLDETVYGGVRSHILSTEPLPKLNRAYAIFIQEEQVQSMKRAKKERSEPVAFAVQVAQGSHDNRDKFFVLCTYCNKTGHEASSCFQFIGYPEWWGERPKATRNAGRGRGNSQQNGGNNRRGRGGPAQANTAQVAKGYNNPSGELPESAVSGLISEQWNTLLNLLDSKKDSTSWISGSHYEDADWSGLGHHSSKVVQLLPFIESTSFLSSFQNCDLVLVVLIFFLTIVDDFSRGVWTYLLVAKNEVRLLMNDYLARHHLMQIFGYLVASHMPIIVIIAVINSLVEVFTSRDVTFVEHEFPYKALTEPTATATSASQHDEPILAEDLSHDLSAPVVSPDSIHVASHDTGDVHETINTSSLVPVSPTLDEHASDDRGALRLLRHHCNNNRRWGAILNSGNNQLI